MEGEDLYDPFGLLMSLDWYLFCPSHAHSLGVEHLGTESEREILCNKKTRL